jgi:hypothetical protein
MRYQSGHLELRMFSKPFLSFRLSCFVLALFSGTGKKPWHERAEACRACTIRALSVRHQSVHVQRACVQGSVPSQGCRIPACTS